MDAVKYFVGGVVSADDLDVAHGPRRECDGLPTLTFLVSSVNDAMPLQMIRRNVDVVGIRTVVAIPQEQPNAPDKIRLWKLDDDRT